MDFNTANISTIFKYILCIAGTYSTAYLLSLVFNLPAEEVIAGIGALVGAGIAHVDATNPNTIPLLNNNSDDEGVDSSRAC